MLRKKAGKLRWLTLYMLSFIFPQMTGELGCCGASLGVMVSCDRGVAHGVTQCVELHETASESASDVA